MIKLHEVSKTLGEFSLSNIDLHVEQGDYFVLLGPSGVGKTVLLELIAGLLSPDKGEIIMNGENITGRPPEKRNIGLVYQDYALFPHLSVSDNIAYGLRARGISSDKARESAAKAASTMGVFSLLSRKPATLSGGEKQRVALARALVINPKILLLDEPLAAVDPGESERLRQVLRDINQKQGVTVLHVTHSSDEALFLAKRVGVMMDGTIRQEGSTEAIFQSPSDPKVADFLGLKNVFAIDKVTNSLCTIGELEFKVASASENSKHLWIRPEDIILSPSAFDSSAANQFNCVVVDWESSGRLFNVHISIKGLIIKVLITHSSFFELKIKKNTPLYATFKSTAAQAF